MSAIHTPPAVTGPLPPSRSLTAQVRRTRGQVEQLATLVKTGGGRLAPDHAKDVRAIQRLAFDLVETLEGRTVAK